MTTRTHSMNKNQRSTTASLLSIIYSKFGRIFVYDLACFRFPKPTLWLDSGKTGFPMRVACLPSSRFSPRHTSFSQQPFSSFLKYSYSIRCDLHPIFARQLWTGLFPQMEHFKRLYLHKPHRGWN